MRLLRILHITALAGLVGAKEIFGDWSIGLRPRQVADTLQPFDGAVGGLEAPPITNSGDSDRPYEVEGDTFPDFETAASRTCDTQKNDCADAVNSGELDLEVSDCDAQREECMGAVASATETSFHALVSSDDEFDYYCEL